MKFNYYFLFFLTLISFNLSGQKKEKITYKADELKFRRIDKEPVRKLIGNVIFIQGNTEIKCDSANFYNRKNTLEAFGNILITNSDSSTINAEILIYDGETKSAKLRKNVIYTKGDEQIKTNNLDKSSRKNCQFPNFQMW
jgi:lipopolysaccharide export system protein LptA